MAHKSQPRTALRAGRGECVSADPRRRRLANGFRNRKESTMTSKSTLAIPALIGLSLLALPMKSQTHNAPNRYANPASIGPGSSQTAIRPFRVHIPQEALTDLHRRLAATRWPETETVSDRSQGVQLATAKSL